VQWLLPAAGESDIETLDELPPFYRADTDCQRPAVYQALLAERVADVPWLSNRPYPWQTRVLNESCSACLACGRRCPTGALEADESTDHRAITFDAALCTDCGLCEQVCPQGAVSKRPAVSVDEIISGRTLLMHRVVRRCVICGEPCFPDEVRAGLCAQCQNESEMDDEWLAMLDG